MTGGSDDARPPNDERAKVDAGWDALVEGVESASSDDAEPGAATSERSGSPEPSEGAKLDGSSERSGPSEPGGPSELSGSRRISGSHPVIGRDRVSNESDLEMDRLMLGPPPPLPKLGAPTIEDETDSKADSKVEDPPDATKEAEAEREADSTEVETTADAEADSTATSHAKPDATADSKTDTKATPEPSSEADARISRPSLQVIEGGSKVEPKPAPPRASRPIEPPPPRAEPRPVPSKGLPWGWIGMGAAGLAVAAYLGLRGEPSPDAPHAPPSIATAKPSPRPAPKGPEPAPLPSTEDGSDDDDDGGSGSDNETGAGSSAEPRVPPPGTSPEAAAAFERLPVSPSDRPPVGGIGATGIHVDHIAMGSRVEGGTCRGPSDDFSVTRDGNATVCVRVVHQREKEELQVLWEMQQGSTRRSKMVVQPRHAYRTRGHLKLRKEYIGDWTVKILSTDDVELARHDFTVVP
ncbi:MAG: DUF2914 domain-containing protein [Myxococcales bacterium]|nr:DUF2914 domain-containing protein [Myxococcales bacterium]